MDSRSEELRWAIDHNAGVIRALETKAQVSIGIFSFWLAPESHQIFSGHAVQLPSFLVWLIVVLAVFWNIRVILPIQSRALRRAGETPYFLGNPTAVTAHEFESLLDDSGSLPKELYKIQVIRHAKMIRVRQANGITMLAILSVISYLMYIYFLPGLNVDLNRLFSLATRNVPIH